MPDNKNKGDEHSFSDKVDDLEKRIDEAQKGSKHSEEPAQSLSEQNRSIGMTAGSNFIGSIVGGGIVGYGIGYFFGNLPLWLILFMFAGFGYGIFRAAKIMK